MARAIAEHDDVDYLYSDEDKIDLDGEHCDLFRKPDWSPERLRHQMYTCHLSVLRSSLVRDVGGFHEGFDGSQDHDLVLRVSERARRVVHVPEVLYHWRILPGSGRGRRRTEAIRMGRRQEGGASTPRSARDRGDRRTGRASWDLPGTTVCRSRDAGELDHSDAGHLGERLGRAAVLRRRGRPLGIRQNTDDQCRGRRGIRRRSDA